MSIRAYARQYARFAVAAVAFAGSGQAYAQSHPCGITASSAAVPVLYDPFSPTGLPTTTIDMTINRINTGGGSKTSVINFFLQGQNANTNGTQITPVSLVSGGVTFYGFGQNIFRPYSASPTVTNSSSNAPVGYARILFNGNNDASNTPVVRFQITLPPNLDISASQSLNFDVVYYCEGTGGGPQVQGNGVNANAVTFPVRVISGLQASYSGGDLDFGEVGDKTNADITGAPATWTRNGIVNVRSSGPYRVQMTSQNAYRLTYSGAPALPPNGSNNNALLYSASFMGQTVSNASSTFTPVVCQRAGLNTKQLPLSVRLLEGGSPSKTPAPEYRDIITVTVTPLVAGTAGTAAACPTP